MEEIEILSEEHIEDTIEKKWQWVYKTQHSPIWNITQTFLNKEKFLEMVTDHNEHISPSNPIIDYKKIKITKLMVNS